MARKQIWGTPWDDGGYAWGWAPNDGLWLTWDGFKSTGLVGTDGDDDIYSFGGNDVLSGEGGNDMLDGGEGADLMNGGDGNDTYYVDNVGDVVADFSMLQDANGNPASGGYDIVYSSVSFTLGIGLDELFLVEGSAAADGTGNALDNKIHGNANENVLRGEDGDDTLYGEGGDDELIGDRGFSVQGDDWLYGGADNDTLRGGGGDDHLYGGSQGDTLYGGDDDDVLDGGTGGDTMDGGIGNDDFYVDNATDEVLEGFNQGYDKVFSTVSYSLNAAGRFQVEELRLLDSGGAIDGTGNDLNNAIYGNDSANTLDGRGGSDDLIGNNGDDTYWVSVGDRVFESANEGTDIVYVQDMVDYRLAANVENLVLVTGRNGTGNDLANTITGNRLDNTIDGGLGNDTLNAADGNDTVSFQSWDILTQGKSETIRIDLVQGSAERFHTNIRLPLEFDTLTGFENVRGSNLTETIVGDSRDNKLEGRGGNDILQGNLGTDALDGGDGLDTASYEGNIGSVAVSLGANGATGFAWEFFTTPSGQTHLLSGDTLVSIENVRGSAFGDVIYGNEADNVIDGRGSADDMRGLTGNDTYFVDNANDIVVEHAGAGTLDIVRASVGYALAAGTEVEVLETTSQTGTTAINLTGNELANTIRGNNGANTLDGGDGNDTLFGFGGADTFVFDHLGTESQNQQDIIGDFTNGIDRIDLRGTGVLSFNDLTNGGDRFMEDVGNDVLIHTSVSANTSILLRNVLFSNLDASDFLFA
jgi:Ca2+-binding RTX toxin-like protein